MRVAQPNDFIIGSTIRPAASFSNGDIILPYHSTNPNELMLIDTIVRYHEKMIIKFSYVFGSYETYNLITQLSDQFYLAILPEIDAQDKYTMDIVSKITNKLHGSEEAHINDNPVMMFVASHFKFTSKEVTFNESKIKYSDVILPIRGLKEVGKIQIEGI